MVAVKTEEGKVAKLQSKCGRVIEQFLQECGKQSAVTGENYRSDFRRFLDKVFNKTIDTITFDELDCMDFDVFSQYVNNDFEGLASGTVNRHISSIKALMRHLKARNHLESDISYLDWVNLLPNKSKRIEHMPKEVVMRYISEAGRERFNAPQKQVLIMFAVDTALRLEDYLNLKWSDFSPQDDGVVLTGYGKGNKRWIEKISYEVYEEVLGLKQEQEYGEERVFAPLSRKNVTDMMTRFKDVLEYKDREYSFHSLKKTAVTFAYRLTGDILEAMKKGKHSNIETTQIYLEEIDYGITGMFSLGNHDDELYLKATHAELIEAIQELNKDAVHLINIKLKSIKSGD